MFTSSLCDMNRAEAQRIQRRALSALEKEFGLGTVEKLGGQIGSAYVKLGFILTPGGDAVRTQLAKEQWDKFCKHLHPKLLRADFGREFPYGDKIFTINGCSPTKPKYSIRAVVESGKQYNFPADQVAMKLRIAYPTIAREKKV